jgi:hydrogenase nickel incorporation protein HypB
MCATCGCSDPQNQHDHDQEHHAHGHSHDHDHHHHHDHPHDHDHDHAHDEQARIIKLERAILDKNDRIAERNRGWLAGRGILALNLVSSPGAGKTTLLERTIRELAGRVPIQVIEGDQATDHDATRIRAAGAKATQINTGAGCHLDAAMVDKALRALDPPRGSALMIENVGNLVCPALFDLGEAAKVLISSVTEGEDKPLKYPHMFRACRLLIINKIDLLPHVRFDLQRFVEAARRINPAAEVLQVSATTGAGLGDWYGWLDRELTSG